MDRITIHRIRCRVKLGVPASERRRPQNVRISAGLYLPLRSAARKDDFEQSADYEAVANLIRDVAAQKPYRLVETLAETVATSLLRKFRKLQKVDVSVLKKPKVMPYCDGVEIEIRRNR